VYDESRIVRMCVLDLLGWRLSGGLQEEQGFGVEGLGFRMLTVPPDLDGGPSVPSITRINLSGICGYIVQRHFSKTTEAFLVRNQQYRTRGNQRPAQLNV
jgi:hypothetical protein